MSRSSPDWTPAGNADDAADSWPDLAERLVLAALFAVALALRLYYVFHHDFDSDEWQHLHVVWAWTRGLLQYRDVFDNHMPLFHMLSAPLLARIGETPAILYDMRLAMIPFVLVTVWGTYLIGRRLLGRRAGLRAAALLGLIPNFLSRSIEYRPDILQTMFWILALSVLLGGRIHWRRCLASGLLLGLAAGSSLKSILLLAALGIAALALPLAIGRRPAPVPPLRWIACISAGLAGLVIPPVALALHFHIHGALRHFLYGTVLHNYVPRLGTWSRPLRALLFVPALVLVIVFGIRLGWLPTSGMETIGAFNSGWSRALDIGRHLILPTGALSLFYMALYTRLMRASLLEQAGMDYVTTARAKGLSEWRIVWAHTLRNALLPVVTMAGLQTGGLLGGSVIVETVFGWPGLGLLAFQSLFARDLNLLLGIFFLSACTVVVVNLVVDILYTLLDPRIEVA